MDANLLEMAKRLKSAQRQEAMTQAGLKDDMDYPKDKLLEIRQICRKIVKDFSEEVKSAADAALSIVEEAGVDPAESNRGFLKALYAYSELEEGDRIEMPSEAFMSKASDHEQWFAKSKAAKLKPLVYPFLEAPLEEFCALFDKEFKVYNTALILDGQLYGLGVSGELSRTFKEIMKEKNVLCIDDSNTILRDIIDGSDAPFVYEKLGVRYEHFLLDEFQDTDHIQEEFIWKLAACDEDEMQLRDGALFLVGDPKQSIYRFRGAEPEVYFKAKDKMANLTNASVYCLDYNFRSNEKIISWVNREFMGRNICTGGYRAMVHRKALPLQVDTKALAGVYYYKNPKDSSTNMAEDANKLVNLIYKARNNGYKICRYDKNNQPYWDEIKYPARELEKQ